MANGKARDRLKEQLWRRRIREWQASGLTVRSFCARHGLTEPNFYVWRRALRERRSSAPAFVPVRVIAEERPASGGPLDLLLPGGRTVRVPPGFDAATLRLLLAVLEERPPC